jgi:mevalonate kinase
VQGLGSGADVAACVFGGVVAYRSDPFLVEQLSNTFPISVVYSGKKVPTVDAVNHVNDSFKNNPQLFQEICHGINVCAELGVNYIKQKKWPELGQVMNSQQRLMEELGVTTPQLKEIIDQLIQQPEILGAKISGSGLGDCVVGLGTINEPISFQNREIQILSASISMHGVECEKG